jgi:hypothetical protein
MFCATASIITVWTTSIASRSVLTRPRALPGDSP